MEGLELICFQIISNVGMAKSKYIEAIEHAKENDFNAFDQCKSEGDEFFEQGHLAHAQLIQKEASGETTQVTLLLMHAEDQMMNAESFKILADQFADVYRQLNK